MQQGLAGAQQPLFPGAGFPSATPLFNMGGGALGGTQGVMLQLVLQPLLQRMFGPGFQMGQFSPHSNFYEQQRRLMEVGDMRQAMGQAGAADRETYSSVLRGMVRSSGRRLTDERERAVSTMSADFSQMAPILGMIMPETFDRLHGARGSALLMAQRMFMGGRYARDPVTGRTGLSSETTASMAGTVHQMLYGPGADVSEMKGLGAGRAGLLYDELQRRGLGVRSLERPEQLQALARQRVAASREEGSPVTQEQALKELKGLGDGPEMSGKLRALESGRVASRLKSLSGVVSAMRDIFGDLGRPDAPMNELLEGLQLLTQGGLTQKSPGELERIVRQTAVLARRTGVGMDNMAQLQAGGAQLADQMGVSREFVPRSVQHAAAFAQAYGMTAGNTPAENRVDKSQMLLLDRQLNLSAAKSVVANQYAATTRIAREYGFKPGTEAAAMAEALSNRQTSYEWPPGSGATKPVYQRNAAEHSRIMADALVEGGMPREEAGRKVSEIRGQSAYNSRLIHSESYDTLARGVQATVDLIPRFLPAYEKAFLTQGLSGSEARRLATGTLQTLFTMDPTLVQNRKEVLKTMRANGIPVAPGQEAAVLRGLETGWGHGEQIVKTDKRFVQYPAFDPLIQAHNQRTLREGDLQRDEADVEGRLHKAMAGLGQESVLSRLVDALADTTEESTFKDVAARTLGFQPTEDVLNRVLPPAKAMRKEILAYKAAGDLPDPVARAKVRTEALHNLERMVPLFRKAAQESGLEIGAKTSVRDVQNTRRRLDNRTGAVPALDTLSQKLLDDPLALAILGPGSVEEVAALQTDTRHLARLAQEHSGGDVAVLLATPEQQKTAREVVGVQAEARREERDLLVRRNDVLENRRTGKSEATRLRAQAEKLPESDVAGKARLELEAGDVEELTKEQFSDRLDDQARLQRLRYNAASDVARQLQQKTGADVGVLGRARKIPDAVRTEAREAMDRQQERLNRFEGRLRGGQDAWKSVRSPLEKEKALLTAQPDTPARTAALADVNRRLTAVDTSRAAEEKERKRMVAAGRLDERGLAGRLVEALGVPAEESDVLRTALLAQGVLAGEPGKQLREALPAMEILRKKAAAEGLSLGELLQRGPIEADDKPLFDKVKPVRGQGLAGVSPRVTPEELVRRLEDFRGEPVRGAGPGEGGPPGRHPAVPGDPQARRSGRDPNRELVLSGTLNIPGLGEGTFASGSTGREA